MTDSVPGALTWHQTLATLAILLLTVLLAGVLVYFGRRQSWKTDPSSSLVRSWIAVALVIGLLVFGVVAFTVNDETVRNTLIGGLTASAGAAIAFYFSSKASEGARRDIIDAALGTEQVPDLLGKTVAEAEAVLARTSLRLDIAPNSDTTAGAVVDSGQLPAANTTARRGVVVTVRLVAHSTPVQPESPAPTQPPVPPQTHPPQTQA